MVGFTGQGRTSGTVTYTLGVRLSAYNKLCITRALYTKYELHVCLEESQRALGL
jgi:hypothetical protein